MNELYIARTEKYDVCQSPVGAKFADYIERKLREDGLTTHRSDTTTGITVIGEHVMGFHMTPEEFTKYCTMCGSQRCEGPHTDWIDGCAHRDALDMTQTTSVTNANRIRSMTDEELAEYLICDVEAEAIRRAGRYLTNIEIDRAVVACLDWLQSPVGGDGDG